MTSREIADLTGKQHKHVLEDARNMLEQLGIHSAGFSAQYKDSTGRALPMFTLPKDLTITLVSGYSAPLRHRIVTRWAELEREEGWWLPGRPGRR
jgi:anti-repressor protein